MWTKSQVWPTSFTKISSTVLANPPFKFQIVKKKKKKTPLILGPLKTNSHHSCSFCFCKVCVLIFMANEPGKQISFVNKYFNFFLINVWHYLKTNYPGKYTIFPWIIPRDTLRLRATARIHQQMITNIYCYIYLLGINSVAI